MTPIDIRTHPAGCAVLLGAFTACEVAVAHREGADLVVLFPASTGGPEHIRALLTMLPHRSLPERWVSLQTIEANFSAGASAVVVGNVIVDEKAVARGDAAAVIARARRFLAMPALTIVRGPGPGRETGRG